VHWISSPLVKLYLQTNYCSKDAIIGPFEKNPFNCSLKISPLNTVTKKDSIERRVILDLSFPEGQSVNEFVSRTNRNLSVSLF
jgi:hypothetical protein